MSKLDLIEAYCKTRALTERLCEPLIIEDYGIQPVLEVSPPKWHLAHTTWFFERFLLMHHAKSYAQFHRSFDFLFNSYYKSIGPHLDRGRRGMLSRPCVKEIFRYRKSVDQALVALVDQSSETEFAEFESTIILGINHEQQHQELLLADIKYIFWSNPLRVAYSPARISSPPTYAVRVKYRPEDLNFGACLSKLGAELGAMNSDFSFDNERPAHRVFLEEFKIRALPVSCGDFQNFIDDGGYQNPSLWLSAGWEEVQRQNWEAPLYWEKREGQWWTFTLSGDLPVNEIEPVCHVSFYEVDAFARWSGKRLPTEAEWEHAAPKEVPKDANFADQGFYHPRAHLIPQDISQAKAGGGFYGDVWEWTASSYSAYPGFKPLPAELGEYNGKFMCGQFVLRGGSCVTPAGHIRPTYRNFFPPESRWQFSGVRLAI